ncbi:Disease resistance protein TIR-NBS-LRR class family, partial [Prunus dulcis]
RPLSSSPVSFSLSLSLPRDLGVPLRLPSDGPATTGRADLRRGYYRSASVSPSQPDQPPPRGRPELAEKSCFPTEVRPKLSKLPARNSPTFLHQIDRVSGLLILFMDNQASEVQPISRRNLQRVVEVHRIHHRATLSLRASKSGRTAFYKAQKGKTNSKRDKEHWTSIYAWIATFDLDWTGHVVTWVL